MIKYNDERQFDVCLDLEIHDPGQKMQLGFHEVAHYWPLREKMTIEAWSDIMAKTTRDATPEEYSFLKDMTEKQIMEKYGKTVEQYCIDAGMEHMKKFTGKSKKYLTWTVGVLT